MKYRSQSGFAVLETVLILVVVAIVGFTGWYVWHSSRSADKTLGQTGNSADSTYAKGMDVNGQTAKSSGTELCATVEKICFSYPDNWQVLSNKVEGSPNSQEGQRDNIDLAMKSDGTDALSFISGINGRGGDCEPSDYPAGAMSYIIKSVELPVKTRDPGDWDTSNLHVVAMARYIGPGAATPEVFITSLKNATQVGEHGVCDVAFADAELTGNNYALKFSTTRDSNVSSIDAAKQELNSPFYTQAFDILKTAHYK